MSETLRELSDAATPGEWEMWPNMHGDPYIVEKGKGPITGGIALANRRDDYGRSNALFIAACVNHVRALLAATAPTPDEVGPSATSTPEAASDPVARVSDPKEPKP